MGRKKNRSGRSQKVTTKTFETQDCPLPFDLPTSNLNGMGEMFEFSRLKKELFSSMNNNNLAQIQVKQSSHTIISQRGNTYYQKMVIQNQGIEHQKKEINDALQQICQEYLKQLKEMNEERTKNNNFIEVITYDLEWNQQDSKMYEEKVHNLIE